MNGYVDPYRIPGTVDCYAFAFSSMYPDYQTQYMEMLHITASQAFREWSERIVPALRADDV